MKYGERRADVCACLCISIVMLETLTFHETIALQRFVVSIGIGLRRTAVATALRQLAIARRIPESTEIV